MKNSTVGADRPDVSPYTTIPIGPMIRNLRPAAIRTWAFVVRSSWLDTDGQRISRSTNRHLAELANADAETVARHLAALAEIGAIAIDGHRIVIHERAEGIGELRISLFDDHPAWALSPRAFAVYLGIRKFAGKKSSCNPTDRRLAEFMGMSAGSVKRGMAELRKCLAIVTTCSRFDRDRRARARTIHLTPGKRWAVAKPADPAPDPESAPLNTSTGTKSRSDDRPELAGGIRKSAPEQSENCTLNNRLFAPIEDRREERTEPKPHQPTKPVGRAERPGEVVVGESVPPPPDTDPKAALADELIRRFANQIEASALNAIERTDFRRALRKMIADHGPIAGQWIEAALAVKASKNTVSLGKVAIANLRQWAELSADERAAIPDRTQLEMLEDETAQRKERLKAPGMNSPQVVRSKFDGQERVQRADGTWANKAQPAENGSGTPAHVIMAEREARWAAQRASEERILQEWRAKRDAPADLAPPEPTPEPPPPVDPAELERRERERAERECAEAVERERSRIEFRRVQIEREQSEETNRRLAAWTSRRTAELLPAMRSDPVGLRQRLAAERAIESERIAAEVRAEFAPKFAALKPPPLAVAFASATA